MNKFKITGIGCFAKPETLQRVLTKVLEDFILEEKNPSDLLRSQPIERLSILPILPDTFGSPSGGRASARLHRMECKRITGFFAWIKGGCLVISIFTRDDGGERQTVTARLARPAAFQDDRLSHRPSRAHRHRERWSTRE